MEKEDIETFLEWLQRKYIEDWTKYTYKQIFRIFLKNAGKKNLADMIPLKGVRNKIPDIFTRQEILKMIENAHHPIDKALISALYETGCRIGEMANLKIKDVHFDKYGAILVVDGKTGMRRIRAIFSAPYLGSVYTPKVQTKMLRSGSGLVRTENQKELKARHAFSSCIQH